MLMAWLTILSEIVVAMPFCERTRSQEHSAALAAEDLEQSSQARHEADCPQHPSRQDHRGTLSCDSCALCHVACNAIPALIAEVSGDSGHVYFAASAPSAITFVPEPPQPVPVATLV